MIGKEEKVLGGSTYYAVLREGGAVIVPKTNDSDVSVTNTNSMVPEGTYIDRVSGSTFTVTAKTITGHVGSTGIAVIYNAEPATKILIGDADQDGEITVIDVTYIQQALASIRVLSEEGAIAADADQDDDVTAIDVTGIQRHLAGIQSSGFHIGEYITA